MDRNGGGAQGFKLSSILKLQDTKTSDNKSNLLFHIVEHIEEYAPSILEMAYKEMPVLKRGKQNKTKQKKRRSRLMYSPATKEYLQSAQLEIKDMNNQVTTLEHAVLNFIPIDPEDTFLSSMAVSNLLISPLLSHLPPTLSCVLFYQKDIRE